MTNNKLVLKEETAENPKMMQLYNDKVWHETFCYAVAFDANEKSRRYDAQGKLLMTIISGADATLQAMKAAIDMGVFVKFGYGEKGLATYKFNKELELSCEKGKYEKFNMSLNKNRKALAIIHEDIAASGKYVLSFEGDPAKDIANLLGGSKYGLHILPEWEKVVFEKLIEEKYLVEHELYCDPELMDLKMFSIDLEEEQADRFIEDLVKSGLLPFPQADAINEDAYEDVTPIEEIEDLTSYLQAYNVPMAEKMNKLLIPTHNPLFDETLSHFDSYKRELFPVQSHTATAIAKRLLTQNAIILQGEMSTGKTPMMTAIADGYSALTKKKGYFSVLICPPSLTVKWPQEIKMLIPHAEVHVIKKTEELIKYHTNWVLGGRKKPSKPTFFIISFTTLRNDSAIRPAVEYKFVRTSLQKADNRPSYRDGIICPKCGKPHQTVDSVRTEHQEDKEVIVSVTHNMTEAEFGTTRRLTNGVNPANAFCFYCGESLWMKKVKRRYSNFSEWAQHEKKLLVAINSGNEMEIRRIQDEQPELASSTSMPRRVAAIEYIRRKMSGMIDIAIIDEVHELKGGMTAQGNALGSLVAASKKAIAGTGTLFGGKAEDVYYLLWRLFPRDMVDSGYKFSEVTKFNEEYGNIEETFYEPKDGSGEYSNKNSRGGNRNSRKKVVPGISSFIYGKYMVHNVVNVRLKDVWPDPVELVDTPTIFVDMTPEQKDHYQGMISTFETEIDSREDGNKLYTQMLDYGIGYLDNPFKFPNALYKNKEGNHELIWEATHVSPDQTLPKEAKLQEIVKSEMEECRPCIVYVRDTGSSVAARDVRPRMKEKLEEIGAKVCILDTSTIATNQRSEWLKKKIEGEGYDVCIVSQELVKVGLDLLCTPTLIYYQFSWSLFTINQSSRRSWRIGQTEECRLYYIAYNDCYQRYMAELIAKKNRATAAINGESSSSDGLSAMLGDEGDLQSMLIESVKKGGAAMKGSAEDWISQASDRARELLAGIGKPKVKKERTVIEAVEPGEKHQLPTPPGVNTDIFAMLDTVEAVETVAHILTVKELVAKQQDNGNSKRKKKNDDDQLAFDLFAM